MGDMVSPGSKAGKTANYIAPLAAASEFTAAGSRTCWQRAWRKCQKKEGWGVTPRHLFLLHDFKAHQECGASSNRREDAFRKIVKSAKPGLWSTYRKWCVRGHIEEQSWEAASSPDDPPYWDSGTDECAREGVVCHRIELR